MSANAAAERLRVGVDRENGSFEISAWGRELGNSKIFDQNCNASAVKVMNLLENSRLILLYLSILHETNVESNEWCRIGMDKNERESLKRSTYLKIGWSWLAGEPSRPRSKLITSLIKFDKSQTKRRA